MIFCVAIVGHQNNPLYVQSFTEANDALKLHHIVHCSLDVIDKRVTSRFVWKIQCFSRLNMKNEYSEVFTVGGYKWRLLIYPKGNNVAYHLSLYLDAADSGSLPNCWSRHVQFSLSIINKMHSKNTVRKCTVFMLPVLRWIYHHYCAILMALVSLTWEIKGQPDYAKKHVLAHVHINLIITRSKLYELCAERSITISGMGCNSRFCNASTKSLPAATIIYSYCFRKGKWPFFNVFLDIEHRMVEWSSTYQVLSAIYGVCVELFCYCASSKRSQRKKKS